MTRSMAIALMHSLRSRASAPALRVAAVLPDMGRRAQVDRNARRVLGVVTVLACTITAAAAQQPQKAPPQKAPPAQQAPQTPQAQAPAAPPPPDDYKLTAMIRTAVIALNQANQTGNYTVLRDLGTASFRMSNDASRLAEVFQVLRRRQLDLSPVLFFTPKLIQQPTMDQRGLIRLVGFFETAPERVNFDIYYLWELGQWRLFGIGVVMTNAAEVTAAMPPQQQQPSGQGPAQPAAPNAASAPQPAPADKPKPAASRTPPPPKPQAGAAPAPDAKAERSAVENKTLNNNARIHLGASEADARAPASAPAAQSDAEAPAAEEAAPAEKSTPGFFGLW
jgi:hypothetical protein